MPDDQSYEYLLFSDPEAAVKKIKDDLRQEYTAQKGREEFWNDFYSKNPDLKDNTDIVTTTLSKNLADMAQMPVSQARDRLAELTRERISKLRGNSREGSSNDRDVLHGGVEHGTPFQESSEGPGSSLGDIINRRKRARRKATQLQYEGKE